MLNEITIEGRTYRYANLNAFDAHKLILKLVHKLGPSLKDVNMEADVGSLLGVLGGIEGDPVEDVILPFFQQVDMSLDGKPIKTRHDIDAQFTAETIGDVYELGVRAIVQQVGPAFRRALARFGAAI